jgi:hypothetical protein
MHTTHFILFTMLLLAFAYYDNLSTILSINSFNLLIEKILRLRSEVTDTVQE